MIIFLYGPDTYRSRQKLNEIIGRYKNVNRGGLNLRRYDCKEITFKNLEDEIQQSPMFKGKKLIILENFFSNSELKKKILENTEKFINSKPGAKAKFGPRRPDAVGTDAGDIILFYADEKIPEKDPLFAFLKKQTNSEEFNLLEGQNLRNWTKKEFEKFQRQPSEAALRKIIELVGNDLWRMSNEIKKLVNYKQKQKIEEKDVELLVKPKIESDIFKTIDAVSSRNKKQALSLINKHLEKGDNPLYLLSMMQFQVRNLLVIKNLIESRKPYNAILKESGLHPFVVKKNYLQAGKFTFQELKKIYQKILQADFDIKTGRINSEMALDLLIAEI